MNTTEIECDTCSTTTQKRELFVRTMLHMTSTYNVQDQVTHQTFTVM